MKRIEKGAIGIALISLLMLGGCATRQAIPEAASNGELKPPSPGKARIYVYRPPEFVGGGLFYDIHDGAQNDKVLGTIVSASVVSAEVDPGVHDIWAKTEARVDQNLTVKAGEIQCIRAGAGMGIMIGRPTLQRVDLPTCRRDIKEIVEYQKNRDKKKEEDLGFGFAKKK